jgi:glucose-6-phosphate-specific signal transduction histidine kinase
VSEDKLRRFGVAEANELGNLLVSLGISSEEESGTLVHALLDVYQSVQKVYSSLVPQLLDDHEASRESVRELLWDVREEFRHIDYHIHDAELTDL